MSKELQILPAKDIQILPAKGGPDYEAPLQPYEPPAPQYEFRPMVPPVPAVPRWDPLPSAQEIGPLFDYQSFRGYLWTQRMTSSESTYSWEVEEFIVKQFQRFNVRIPTQDFLIWCWDIAFYYVTNIDADSLFFGQSDVRKVQDHRYFQYVIKNSNGDFCEISSNGVDVYRYHANYKQRFLQIYQNPGLNHCFQGLERYVKKLFADQWESRHQLDKFIRQYKDESYDMIHLAVWSSVVWMISPRASHWRYASNILFNLCYDHGECILHYGVSYTPDEYRRLSRAAHSCKRCGNRSSCVKVYNVNLNKGTFVENGEPSSPFIKITGARPGSYMLCQRCLADQVHQGSKCHRHFCIETGCKHHPNPTLSRGRVLS